MKTTPHTIIIAEAGVNHNGSLQRALEMVDCAAQAGADYVKFQTFHTKSLVTSSAPKAEYQKHNAPEGDTQLSMLKALELSDTDFKALSDRCRERGIGFMSTPFDIEAADMLSSLDMDYWKIPSGEITNLPLLRHIGKMQERVILSTGMCTLDEVDTAVNALVEAGTPRRDIILLHCTTQYPAPAESVNLMAMNTLKTLGCHSVGYSDHTQGISIPLAAVALGASVIEKHFTLDRNLPGPDHRASLEPNELKSMIDGIRQIEKALGSSDKFVTDAERPNISIARKSIVAAREIKAGEVFSTDNLTTKRPGSGLSPMLWDSVIGTHATHDYLLDQQIDL